MRLRKIPGIEKEFVNFPNLMVDKSTVKKGCWRQRFPQAGPLHLEVGMGRGKFMDAMTQANPDINYVALELQNEVIYRALCRIGDDRKNLLVIQGNAAQLTDWFAPGEVERIYLNFSDPWPKKRHSKRRLTHENFLKLYREILAPKGELEFRTDARNLMEFTLTEMTNNGFSLVEVSLDLHDSPCFNGMTTEYEDRQSKKGPIYYGRFVRV
ncbi:MAG: tRNA (guanosine(46)-N7)-methyltransferase TrmB [Bacillota bacterium]|nr:tRNA (guanosine(46)-N7)-methyltransferase TrmB [Bacillota bacterium]